jgi:Na+/H+ antiporter NhaD/arsenite permease-like protein
VWLAVIIFALTATGLGVGRIPGLPLDRAGIAFVGAVLMLVTGVLSLQDALSPQSIDYETLLLLFSMMIVIGVLRLGGAFDWLSHTALDHITSPRALLATTIVLSGVLSAFLINDIVCVALTPLVLHIARRMRYDPVPHLLGLATAANVGSAATITGNPQNMIIGLRSRIPYLVFVAHLMPVALVGLLLTFGIIAVVYRRALAAVASPTPAPPPPEAPAPKPRVVPIVVTIATVVAFCAGLPIPLVAAGAAAVLLVSSGDPAAIYDEIDWRLLVMFAGLFVVVHAFQVRVVTHWHIEQWTAVTTNPITGLGLLAAGLSNIVSNVPAVLLCEPLVHAVAAARQQTAWLSLAMSSTFAGNLTVLGSVANLIVVERARREGVLISFVEYLKAGVPITVLTLAAGFGWLALTS